MKHKYICIQTYTHIYETVYTHTHSYRYKLEQCLENIKSYTNISHCIQSP